MSLSNSRELDIFEILSCYDIVDKCARELSAHLEPINFVPDLELEEENVTPTSSTEEPCEESQNEEEGQKADCSGEEIQREISEDELDSYLNALSREVIPDEELSKLPSDDINDVFPFFMRCNVQMPNFDDTPLGAFLLKKKEDKFDDMPMYELEEMMNFTLMENKVLEIQNTVFRHFLKKNDPRYDDEKANAFGITDDDIYEKITFDLATSKISRSKVVLPDEEECGSEEQYKKVLVLFINVVEHEIKQAHREYEVEQNKFEAKMEDLGAVRDSLKIHSDKIKETSNLLKDLVVKKRKRKVSFDLLRFAEFLKVAVKQDQQDLRRLKVLKYDNDKKIRSIRKTLKSRGSIHSVDLRLYEMKCTQLSTKLVELNDEFLQLKKISDSYQKRYGKIVKKLRKEEKALSQNRKRRDAKARALGVQNICYKMALESIIGATDAVTRLHCSLNSEK